MGGDQLTRVKFVSTRAGVSGLLLLVCFLVLLSFSPASSTTPMWSSNSWSSGWNQWSQSWNPTFTYSQGGGWNPGFTQSQWSWNPSYANPSYSYANTWRPTWTWTGPGQQQSWTWTGSGKPSWTWTGTWHSWSGTWSNTLPTWSATWRTQTYSTWTQYNPSYTWYQPGSGCYPGNPYCNGYYPFYPQNGYYPAPSQGYVVVGLRPILSAPGGQVSVQGTGFLPTDTTCTISSPTSPYLILNGSAGCAIQSGIGIAVGSFIVGNVPAGYYVVQITGNEGDFGQTIVSVQ